jgi:hypothetical protein
LGRQETHGNRDEDDEVAGTEEELTMDGAVILPQRSIRPAAVRIATPTDYARIFDIFMLAAAENAMAPICEAKVEEAITLATERRNGSVIGIIDGDRGDIAGIIGLVMAPFWYSHEWHCEELLNFVHPDYRMGTRRCAHDLLAFAKWWADQMGMALLMGVLSHKRTEGKVRLYRRQLPFAGALFLYRGGAA